MVKKKNRNDKNSPQKWTPVFEKTQINFVPVHVSQIIFTSDQQNWSLRTKTSDFRIPHGYAIFQRHRIRY